MTQSGGRRTHAPLPDYEMSLIQEMLNTEGISGDDLLVAVNELAQRIGYYPPGGKITPTYVHELYNFWLGA